MINAVIATNLREGGPALIYGSHKEDSKKNPLSHTQKFEYLEKMFPALRKSLQSRANEKTALEVADTLNGKYNKMIMIAGSDRVSEFKSLLNTYNGKKGGHGSYEFEEIEEKKIMELIAIYNRDTSKFGSNQLKRISVSGFFTNIF